MNEPDARLLQTVEELLEHSRRQATMIEHLLAAMRNDQRLPNATLDEYRRQLANALATRERIDAMVKALCNQLRNVT